MRYTVLYFTLVNAVLSQRFDDETPPNYSPSTPYRERESLPSPVFGLGHRDREVPEEERIRDSNKDYGRRPTGRDSSEQDRGREREFVRIPHGRNREERKEDVDAQRERPEYIERPERRRQSHAEEPRFEGRNFRQRHGEGEDNYRPNGGTQRSQDRDSHDSQDSGDRERAKIVGVNMHMVAGIYPEGKRGRGVAKEDREDERFRDRETPEDRRMHREREHKLRPDDREPENRAPGRFSELSGPYPEPRKSKEVESLGNPYPRKTPAGGPDEDPYRGEKEGARGERRHGEKDIREEEPRYREHHPSERRNDSEESDGEAGRRGRPDRNRESENEPREVSARSREKEERAPEKEGRDRAPKEDRRPQTMPTGGFPDNFPPFRGFEEPDFHRFGRPDSFFPKQSEGRDHRRRGQSTEDNEPEERIRDKRPRPSRDSRENESLEEDLHKRVGNGSFRDSDEARRMDSRNGDRSDRKPNLVDGEAGRTAGTDIPVITPSPREDVDQSEDRTSQKEKSSQSKEEPEKILEDIMNAHLNETTVTDDTATAVAFAAKTMILPDEPLATNDTVPISKEQKIRVR